MSNLGKKINQTVPQLKKTCRMCHKGFTARYSHQRVCQDCRHAQMLAKRSRERAHDATIQKNKAERHATQQAQRDQALEGKIAGIPALAEFLNIGETDLRKKLENEWVDLPREEIDHPKGARPTLAFSAEQVNHYFNNPEKEDPRQLTLALKGYKEPLTKVKEGFGYYGVLLQTDNGEYVQCHLCGRLFKHLSGHIWQAHKMKTNDFRDKFGLSHTTALTSEKTRWELKERTIKWLNSLTPEEKETYREQQKQRLKDGAKKRRPHQPKKALEGYNKDGTCPDQLLQKIKDVAQEMGRTPSLKEFVAACGTQRYKHLIFKVYGSWERAVEMAGLDKKGRPDQRGKTTHRYDDDELLEYLVIFARENDEIPTHTDFLTSLLPSEETYLRRFGSIEKARQLAGVYDVVSPEKVAKFKKVPKKLKFYRNMRQFTLNYGYKRRHKNQPALA